MWSKLNFTGRGRERQRQVEKCRGKLRQAVAGKVVGNVLSLYTPCIRQRQVKKGRGRQRQERYRVSQKKGGLVFKQL